MYQITKIHRTEKYGKGPRVYNVYSKEEAEALNLEFIHWRDVTLDTPKYSWVLSDDDYVCELIDHTVTKDKWNPKGGPSTYFYFPYTRAMFRQGAKSIKMEFMPHWETQNFSYYDPTKTWERGLKDVRFRWFANAYAIMIVNGSPLDYNALGKILRPKYKNPGYYAKRKLKNPKVEAICMEALDVLLTRKGAGREHAIDMILKSAQFAETSKSSKDLLAVAKLLAEINGIGPTKVTKIQKLEGDFDRMLEGGETIKGSISGKQTIETLEMNNDERSSEETRGAGI